MKESINTLIDYLIKKNIELLTAKIYIKNHPSIQLVEALGFEKEGELVKSFRYPRRKPEPMLCYYLDLNKTKISKNLNKWVQVTIDRPLGSKHPKYTDLIYPINYGYIKGIYSGDGEEQDAYVLGVDKPIEIFNGKVIGIVHRLNDVEDKWNVSDKSYNYTKEEIENMINFQEKFFEYELIL